MAASLDWTRGFSLDFSLQNGRSQGVEATARRLSQMGDMYFDTAAAQAAIQNEDPLIYEFYELGAPQSAGDLAFGTSIIYAGKVGDEYYMTKGHFHTILDTSEVYYCMAGKGAMLTESPEGDTILHELTPGQALYVPPRYAHRSINTGKETLVTFFVFRGDAGHDYGTIETKGYRKLLVERDGKPTLIDNPRWR
ncbi:MAG: cupin domain-containing protein [Christensenellaceae bacterium]|jgi:glucose-6-phosphate isomerase|nr:cupin domain-containing protein [Christensenellaceae bacterium]